MKKTFTFLMAVMMMFSISITNVLASDFQSGNQDIITFEEFENALKAEFEQYGIEFEAQQTDMTFIYTKDILEEELEKARKFGQANLENQKKNDQISNDNETMFPYADEKNFENSIILFNMPGTISAYTDRRIFLRQPEIFFLPSDITIRTHADVMVNFQSDSITGGSITSLEIRAATYAEDYVRLLNYSKSINNSSSNRAKRYISFDINAEFKQNYSIPGGVSWAKVDNNFMVKIYPYA